MSELEFYRIAMGGISGILILLIGMVYHDQVCRLGRLERKLSSLVEAWVTLEIGLHPSSAPEIMERLSPLIANGVKHE